MSGIYKINNVDMLSSSSFSSNETYQLGEDINAGEFVGLGNDNKIYKLPLKTIKDLTINQAYNGNGRTDIGKFFKIDTNKYLIANPNSGLTNAYFRIADISTSPPTFGQSLISSNSGTVNYTNPSSEHRICILNTTTFLYAYWTSGTVYIQKYTISGNTITSSGQGTAFYAPTNLYAISINKLDSNRAIAVCGTYDGTVSGIYYMKACIIDCTSGISCGTIYDVTPSVNNVSPTPIIVQVINTNKFVIAFADINNSGYLTIVCGSASGSSITFGSKVVIYSSAYPPIGSNFDAHLRLFKTDNDKFLVVYSKGESICNNSISQTYIRAATVNGTTITTQNEVKLPLNDLTTSYNLYNTCQVSNNEIYLILSFNNFIKNFNNNALSFIFFEIIKLVWNNETNISISQIETKEPCLVTSNNCYGTYTDNNYIIIGTCTNQSSGYVSNTLQTIHIKFPTFLGVLAESGLTNDYKNVITKGNYKFSIDTFTKFGSIYTDGLYHYTSTFPVTEFSKHVAYIKDTKNVSILL